MTNPNQPVNLPMPKPSMPAVPPPAAGQPPMQTPPPAQPTAPAMPQKPVPPRKRQAPEAPAAAAASTSADALLDSINRNFGAIGNSTTARAKKDSLAQMNKQLPDWNLEPPETFLA